MRTSIFELRSSNFEFLGYLGRGGGTPSATFDLRTANFDLRSLNSWASSGEGGGLPICERRSSNFNLRTSNSWASWGGAPHLRTSIFELQPPGLARGRGGLPICKLRSWIFELRIPGLPWGRGAPHLQTSNFELRISGPALGRKDSPAMAVPLQ